MEPQKRAFCEGCNQPVTPIDFSAETISLHQLNSDDFKITSKSYGSALPMMQCVRCSLIQVGHIVSFEQIVALYRNVSDSTYMQDADVRSFSNYQQIIEKINENNINKISVLEIGCGGGHTLDRLSSDFKYAVGIEPSESLYVSAKNKLDGQVYNCSFETFETSNKFDCIIAVDVIEHVTSPAKFLKKIHSYLKSQE